MDADEKARQLAASTSNFGYLLADHPLLVTYGAWAEALVFDDPNTAMMKCRQFGETLTARLFIQFGIPNLPDKQYQRVKILNDQGILKPQVHGWFTRVRQTGNKATHDGYAEQRDALDLVRACYDLGAWFHRTVDPNGAPPPPFVPPQPPLNQPAPTTDADAVAWQELQGQLAAYRAELVEMRLELDDKTTMAVAEAAAQRSASAEILRAVQAQAGLPGLVAQLSSQVGALQQQLSQQAAAVEPIDAMRRDELVSRATLASRPPFNEAQVRRMIDRMLTDAGWQIQDVADTNVHAGLGVAVREVTTARGRADYLLYVDAKLIGVIEAKREGVSLGGVDRQSDRYAHGLDKGQRLAAWREPLPFRYESSAVETQFTNALDPVVRPRRVFSFHQPQTIATWMRDAESTVDALTLRHRLLVMPPLNAEGLRDAQVEAITGLERSLAEDRPRALIQMARRHLDDFVKAYRPGSDRAEREESERFKSFTYDELLTRDKVNLDITWLRDSELEDSDNLPAPEVIAQEIVDDLQAALDEFAAVAESLALRSAHRGDDTEGHRDHDS